MRRRGSGGRMPGTMRAERVGRLGGMILALLFGCAGQPPHPGEADTTPTLTIRWQRLVEASGETCPRCATTGQEVQRAVEHLARSLAPVGVRVRLETERIEEAAFREAPLESNRIWVSGLSLEDWLGARAASSPCCDACAGADCRTVVVGPATYEAIPAALVIRAGFMATGEILRRHPPAAARVDSASSRQQAQ